MFVANNLAPSAAPVKSRLVIRDVTNPSDPLTRSNAPPACVPTACAASCILSLSSPAACDNSRYFAESGSVLANCACNSRSCALSDLVDVTTSSSAAATFSNDCAPLLMAVDVALI